MDLTPKIKEICKLLEIVPSRSKGQNFLVNEKIYDGIVKAADLKPTESVLEIGPGLGFLTMKLAAIAKKVLAVELDDNLARYLQMGIDAAGINNVKIINEDILKFNLDSYINEGFGKTYKIVANLPYNITSIFLRQIFGLNHKPELMVLMLQSEVAERIAAKPGEMSILAISVQYYADIEIIREVKAANFWPAPKVDSAVISFKIKAKNYLNHDYNLSEDKIFFRLIKFGFSAKRKMLKNNLAGGLKIKADLVDKILLKHNLNPKIRAEDLSLGDWYKIFADFSQFMV
ncbi:MAG: 16S rRNA (adenine(1518)-N(6)/adenine(1519)-N(6))-dimethyltransferase RsmA [Patescibacteria group bacterium]